MCLTAFVNMLLFSYLCKGTVLTQNRSVFIGQGKNEQKGGRNTSQKLALLQHTQFCQGAAAAVTLYSSRQGNSGCTPDSSAGTARPYHLTTVVFSERPFPRKSQATTHESKQICSAAHNPCHNCVCDLKWPWSRSGDWF